MANQVNLDYGYQMKWDECKVSLAALDARYKTVYSFIQPGASTSTNEGRILKYSTENMLCKMLDFNEMLDGLHYQRQTRDVQKLELLKGAIETEKHLLNTYASPVFLRSSGEFSNNL